ncbi:MAG TPA: siderophore-interacting protein [Acidimicrobiales bacterium]|nr:siderophore-interacting protein [Acidimicrobiales bacterium]
MSLRLRREPPRFRRVTVRGLEPVTSRLHRVTLGGDDLDGFEHPGLAASVRLLLSHEKPTWNGNEFLLADGTRPVIRTLTPLRFDPEALTLDVEIVRHDGGAMSAWVDVASPGDEVAISGPGRGYDLDTAAPAFVIAGDETALPAIGQLLEAVPSSTAVTVDVEVADPAATIPHIDASWHVAEPDAPPGDSLVRAVEAAVIPDGARVWVAGEAAAVQRIRKHLFEQRGLPRSQCTVRGYWKHGRAGGEEGS